MQLCIFNPEHDLCLAKGRVHYVPPRSAVEFARRDAAVMQVLYPGACCRSVYDLPVRADLPSPFDSVVAWGWDAVVRHELLKRGVDGTLLPSEATIEAIRALQHRTTVLPLQPDCREVRSVAEAETLLRGCRHWVLKAPWSGAGRGLRWVHGTLTDIDRHWIEKTAASQRCVIAEPRREVFADLALEYLDGIFAGYSLFRTGSGVYKENVMWTDSRIEAEFATTGLQSARQGVEAWLATNVWPRYRGPLGIDLMVCPDGSVHVAEMNVRHTMGMIAHRRIANAEQTLLNHADS